MRTFIVTKIVNCYNAVFFYEVYWDRYDVFSPGSILFGDCSMPSFEYFNIPYHLKIYLIINRSCPYYFFMYVFMSQNSVSTIKPQSNKFYLKAISIITDKICGKWSCTEVLFILDYQQLKRCHVFCFYFVSFRFVSFCFVFLSVTWEHVLRHIAYYINLPHSLKPRNNFE